MSTATIKTLWDPMSSTAIPNHLRHVPVQGFQGSKMVETKPLIWVIHGNSLVPQPNNHHSLRHVEAAASCLFQHSHLFVGQHSPFAGDAKQSIRVLSRKQSQSAGRIKHNQGMRPRSELFEAESNLKIIEVAECCWMSLLPLKRS